MWHHAFVLYGLLLNENVFQSKNLRKTRKKCYTHHLVKMKKKPIGELLEHIKIGC